MSATDLLVVVAVLAVVVAGVVLLGVVGPAAERAALRLRFSRYSLSCFSMTG